MIVIGRFDKGSISTDQTRNEMNYGIKDRLTEVRKQHWYSNWLKDGLYQLNILKMILYFFVLRKLEVAMPFDLNLSNLQLLTKFFGTPHQCCCTIFRFMKLFDVSEHSYQPSHYPIVISQDECVFRVGYFSTCDVLSCFRSFLWIVSHLWDRALKKETIWCRGWTTQKLLFLRSHILL